MPDPQATAPAGVSGGAVTVGPDADVAAAATAPGCGTHEGTPARQDARALRWWRELAYVAVLYAVYSLIRNQFGSAAVGEAEALANAERVIALERALGTFHEVAVQQWFLDARPVVQALNVLYGTLHFAVTIGVLVWLFRSRPADYLVLRTVLVAATALALVGFAAFPLLPPRLLPPGYGFVDTVRDLGGLWSFESAPVAAVSNQYAAMPSLHFAWSAWCALALVPALRRRLAKAVAAAYPALTLVVIVVTANHYWVDAAGGLVVLGLGWLSWRVLESLRGRPGEVVVGRLRR